MKEKREVLVNWKQSHQVLKLEGEPVLEYTIIWPEIQGAGLGGWWITRYYARLARLWKKRWDQEVYCQACLDLGVRRQASRPFIPWQGELKGETALLEDGLLSLRFTGWETRGDGRTSRVRWGDVWKVREGAPCSLQELLKEEPGWKKRLERACGPGGAPPGGGRVFSGPGLAEKSPGRPAHGGLLPDPGGDRSLSPPGSGGPNGRRVSGISA